MIVPWAAMSPVVGSAVKSSDPVTLNPTMTTTKKATTPTIARVQVAAIRRFLPCRLAGRRPLTPGPALRP